MIKVGLIGAGYWGKNILRNLYNIEECKLIMVVDKDEKVIKKWSSLYPDIYFTSKEDEIFNSEVDAIVIATPAVTHYSLVKRALKSNKNVFVEKPLALSLKKAEEIAKLADRENLILMVGHLLLYHPAVRLMKRMIENGEIGEIYYIYSSRLNLGKVRSDENVLWSLAPHDISIILYFMEEKPHEALCRGGSFLQKKINDIAFLYLGFPSGKIAHVHVSWLDPHKIRKTVVVGSKKMIVFDDTEPHEKIKVYDKGIDVNYTPEYPLNFNIRFGDIYIPRIDMVEPLKEELRHFILSIKNGTRPLTDGWNGVEVVRVLEMAGGKNE